MGEFYYFVVTKQINRNKYYIIVSLIPYNTYPYSYVMQSFLAKWGEMQISVLVLLKYK